SDEHTQRGANDRHVLRLHCCVAVLRVDVGSGEQFSEPGGGVGAGPSTDRWGYVYGRQAHALAARCGLSRACVERGAGDRGSIFRQTAVLVLPAGPFRSDLSDRACGGADRMRDIRLAAAIRAAGAAEIDWADCREPAVSRDDVRWPVVESDRAG